MRGREGEGLTIDNNLQSFKSTLVFCFIGPISGDIILSFSAKCKQVSPSSSTAFTFASTKKIKTLIIEKNSSTVMNYSSRPTTQLLKRVTEPPPTTTAFASYCSISLYQLCPPKDTWQPLYGHSKQLNETPKIHRLSSYRSTEASKRSTFLLHF